MLLHSLGKREREGEGEMKGREGGMRGRGGENEEGEGCGHEEIM